MERSGEESSDDDTNTHHPVDHEEIIGYQMPDVEYHCFGYPGYESGASIERQLNDGGGIAALDVQINDDDWQDWAGWASNVMSSQNCTPLRVLRVFKGSEPDHPIPNVRFFCSELADNRTIEHLTTTCFDLTNVDMFDILAPFFEHNDKLRCIEFLHFESLPMKIPSLISALLTTNHLERIELYNGQMGDDRAADLIRAIVSIPGFHSLLDLGLGSNNIGKGGCVALVELLTNPQCNMQRLNLSDNDIDNDCIDFLIRALTEGNNAMKELDLMGQKLVTSIGWSKFTIVLSSSRCSLLKLKLGENNIGDEGATSIGESLVINTTLNHLDMRPCNSKFHLRPREFVGPRNSITPTGWREFSNCLRSPTSTLKELNLNCCDIVDMGAVAIFVSLAENASVRKLSMANNHFITPRGWKKCFRAMMTSQSSLEDIDLRNNNIDDDAARALIKLLVNHMTSVKCLDVDGVDSITDDGWRLFAQLLHPDSTSNLKKLELGSDWLADRSDGDAIIRSFARALSGNTSLETLTFTHAVVSKSGWNPMIQALSDNSSIESTLHSNHTLNRFHSIRSATPKGLYLLLKLNKHAKKIEVAREKIIMNHFTDKDDIFRAFSSMPCEILTNAIELLGKKGGLSAMFQLLQSMPYLLDFQGASERE